MYITEKEQLLAMGKFFVKHPKNLIQLMKDKNWDRFAFYYNGSAYKLNKYDTKLATAYKKYAT